MLITCALAVMSSLAWSIMLSKASVDSFSQGSINPGPSVWGGETSSKCKCERRNKIVKHSPFRCLSLTQADFGPQNKENYMKYSNFFLEVIKVLHEPVAFINWGDFLILWSDLLTSHQHVCVSDLVAGCLWRCTPGLCAWPLLGWAGL